MPLRGKFQSLLGVLVITILIAHQAEPAPPEERPDSAGKAALRRGTGAGLPPKSEYAAFEKDRREFKALEDAITPSPLTPIPDDPPPHEGAMFDLPYVIEPPDLIRVEVFEALMGKPITGERLVRADGSIALGFYGDVHVRGLTLEQAKTKIILRLRQYLTDEALGLFQYDPRGESPKAEPPPSPPGPRPVKPPEGAAGHDSLDTGILRRTTSDRLKRGSARTVVLTEDQKDIARPTQTPEAPRTSAGGAKRGRVPLPAAPEGDEEQVDFGRLIRVPPEASMVAFVDVSAYNSKFYFVQGDVGSPGKYPSTGGNTVLEAIENAQGLKPTAELNDIRLVRPARGGKPSRIYKLNYKAIVDEGDVRQNYQLFPGDRLIVGRNPLAQKTVVMDRLYAPVQTALHGMTNYFNMLRALSLAAPDLTPEQRQAIVRESAAFWWRWASNPDGARMDQKAFEEALTRHLDTLTKKPAPSGKK